MVTIRPRATQEAVPPVSSIPELYRRFRHLIHEGAKFLVIGGIGSLVTIGGAAALRSLGEYKAVTLATIVATFVTFVGNRYWTFRHRQGHGTARETVMFFVLNGVGLLIYYACIWIMRHPLGLTETFWYYVALVVGTGLGTLFRFWSYRKWVWPLTGGGPGQGGAGQGGAGHAGAGHAGAGQNGAGHAGAGQNGTRHAGHGQAGPVKLGPGIGRRPQGRHAANGQRNVGPVQQESLPDAEQVGETSAWPR
jgi:putative flippase GtrA